MILIECWAARHSHCSYSAAHLTSPPPPSFPHDLEQGPPKFHQSRTSTHMHISTVEFHRRISGRGDSTVDSIWNSTVEAPIECYSTGESTIPPANFMVSLANHPSTGESPHRRFSTMKSLRERILRKTPPEDPPEDPLEDPPEDPAEDPPEDPPEDLPGGPPQ